jgi:nucleoside-triphosphatase
VNLEALERLAVPAMSPPSPDHVVIIDEIGKMECFSSLFRDALTQLLDSGNDLLASISQRGDPFIERIKARQDMRVIHVSEKNRDSLVCLAGLFNG